MNNYDDGMSMGAGKKRGEKAQTKIMGKTVKATTGKGRRAKDEMPDHEKNEAAKALVTTMNNAVSKDNNNNSNRRPALEKLFNLEFVTKELRRNPIQDAFIENQGGCEALAGWLYPLPDGTYPNVKVVQEILQAVDSLSIDALYLERHPKLVKTVKVYSNNKANMPQVQDLAKRIIDKWSRMVFNISTSYMKAGMTQEDDFDEVFENEDKYRSLRRKLDRIQD